MGGSETIGEKEIRICELLYILLIKNNSNLLSLISISSSQYLLRKIPTILNILKIVFKKIFSACHISLHSSYQLFLAHNTFVFLCL